MVRDSVPLFYVISMFDTTGIDIYMANLQNSCPLTNSQLVHSQLLVYKAFRASESVNNI